MKKTTLLASFFVLTSLPAAVHADDGIHVITKTADNAYSIDAVQRIDFTGDQLNVVATDGTSTTYAFDQVVKITFSSTTTSLQTPASLKSQRLTFSVASDGSSLTVNGWDSSATASLQLYSVAGTSVMDLAHWSGQTIDLSSLPHGIYVLKVGQLTAKFKK